MEATTTKFQQTIKELTEILEAFSTEQLNKIPFPNSWTAGQVGDHLLKSYGSWKIFKGETEFADRPYDESCKTLSDLFLNFNIKLIAEHSDAIYPSEGYIEKENLVLNIQTVSDRIISFSSRNDLRVLCLDFEFPTLGHMTRFEWLHFYVVHTQRHIKQLTKIFNILNSLK
ncbi:DinB family protein [Sphingobacterium sp. 1.A.4]|uniref:DinB family protein n=1 Tax=Sphingobacterium sp. 1.A.4 TaxID=2044603 RepID=UPI000C0BD3CF|nr:DinB family protein [Sphingobacterium sp. 1.A.4]